ncbi:hypothetical protein J5N97_005378 [Dioscorea zingiberensis]|uniref:Uncharacterized protein n=1 Tax=Dioscorea zingiberensis TaxID=325984 RepID=A0A9D5D9Q9_9LILI|nr:hypothetical protein J5N97_005378 [Dioscorea zingiberensis]
MAAAFASCLASCEIWLHFGRFWVYVLALDKFRNDFGRFPAAGSSEDTEKLIAFAGKVDRKIVVGWLEEIDIKLLHQSASGSGAVFNPMVAVFGGIVGEEVLKSMLWKIPSIIVSGEIQIFFEK